MNVMRIGVLTGLLGWLGGSGAMALPRMTSADFMLARAGAKEDKIEDERAEGKTKKETKKEHKKEKAETREKEGKETEKESTEEGTTEKHEIRASESKEVTGILTVKTDEDGGVEVFVTDADGRNYQLDIPEDALPKARELAGKKVAVRGRVRDRNGEFRIEQVRSCRPVTTEEKPAAEGDGAANE